MLVRDGCMSLGQCLPRFIQQWLALVLFFEGELSAQQKTPTQQTKQRKPTQQTKATKNSAQTSLVPKKPAPCSCEKLTCSRISTEEKGCSPNQDDCTTPSIPHFEEGVCRSTTCEQACPVSDPTPQAIIAATDLTLLDYKHKENIMKNKRRDEGGHVFNWLHVKSFQYRKEEQGIICYKYNYSDEYNKIDH
ncbi:uncharacterized protein LOC115925510 [Strongylocentrotus purpuratus]|uniref:Uncharacterized protein n=1 Tax=Strongylocentrotus purpuratus TaxID=7668 RepID=A0A7M7P392_STRPU|nr:uncharacterized protein LOC115925510 [Strongylocentrotus purpuratus]